MPNLQRLVARGGMTALTSPEPLGREALLTTVATGMLADRHGVAGARQVRADGGGVEPVGQRTWRAPAFWQTLAQAGLRTACINWPATAPAKRWPGVHVDESFATPTGRDFSTWAVPPGSVSPAGLADELAGLRVHPTDQIYQEVAAFIPSVRDIDQAADLRLPALGAMLARAITVHAAATHIAQTRDWDVLCVAYEFLHAAKLRFGGEMPGSAYAGVVPQAHRYMDMMLGRMVELAGPGATVILVSPNGLSSRVGEAPAARPRGLLVAAGEGIEADSILPGARLVDVAPTILARHGWEAPSDGSPIAALVPPGLALAPAPAPPAPEAEAWDPAAELASQGYADPLSRDQHSAMEGAEAERLCGVGEALLARGRLQDAAKALDAARGLRPHHIPTLRALARCRTRMGEYDACRELGEALLAAAPALPWGYIVLGVACALGTAPSDPESYLASARELGAGMPEALTRLGSLELLRENPAIAAADFEAAIQLDPEMGEAAYGLGVARFQLNEMAAAEAAFRRAIELEHNQPLAHLHLGTLLASQGRLRDALQPLQTALEQNPGVPGIEDLLARTRAALAQQLAVAAIEG